MPEIGGFFELELPNLGDPFPAPLVKYQSARAALRALLEQTSFTKVLIPAYVCDSVPRAVEDAGLEAQFYHLDSDLLPSDLPALADDVALLYVNYFGICTCNVARLRQLVPEYQLVIDNTQALFAEKGPELAAIYSPRKFVGLPDGGLLAVNGVDIRPPGEEDSGSLDRMDHLLIRLAGSAREGYSHFQESGRSLEDTRPLRMSRLTDRLLASVDMASAKRRRRANFEQLAEALGHLNLRAWRLDAESVPLCYPLTLDRDMKAVRGRLAQQGIFVPAYWEDARPRTDVGSVEHSLLDQTLALPCDQRYGVEQIDMLAGAIRVEIETR